MKVTSWLAMLIQWIAPCRLNGITPTCRKSSFSYLHFPTNAIAPSSTISGDGDESDFVVGDVDPMDRAERAEFDQSGKLTSIR